MARSACGRAKRSCATTAESVDSQLVGALDTLEISQPTSTALRSAGHVRSLRSSRTMLASRNAAAAKLYALDYVSLKSVKGNRVAHVHLASDQSTYSNQIADIRRTYTRLASSVPRIKI